MQNTLKYGPSWSIALYVLVIVFAIAAILNMIHLRIPFLTTHAADISGPALLYIQFRRAWQQGNKQFLTRIFGRSPEIAASTFFFGSVITEISQKYYPHGIFRGVYDLWDIAAYAVGVGTFYFLEKSRVDMIESEIVNSH